MTFKIHNANCLDVLRQMPDNSVDSIVTDPPYGLAFMGKKWDYDVPSVEIWAECLRVLKPGGHLLAFAGTRTQHRMAVRIEDAGFEIRDMIAWVYGSGFPKSLDVSKAIDKHGGVSVAWFGPWFRAWREGRGITQKEVASLFPSRTGNLTGCVANWELGLNMPTPDQFNAIRDRYGLPFDSLVAAKRAVLRIESGSNLAVAPGQGKNRSARDIAITAAGSDAARQWEGWGTALKPALEPITVARKPLAGTVAANVLAHGTGAMNIDGCRVGDEVTGWGGGGSSLYEGGPSRTGGEARPVVGRWPANLIHDGSEEVLAAFPDAKGQQGRARTDDEAQGNNTYGALKHVTNRPEPRGDEGSAARFFYCAKASKKDREDGNNHPTVKPTDLMRYLCRLVTPPGGTVLDPFTGSGSTGKAAMLEGFRFIGCEMSAEYAAIAEARVSAALDDYICSL